MPSARGEEEKVMKVMKLNKHFESYEAKLGFLQVMLSGSSQQKNVLELFQKYFCLENQFPMWLNYNFLYFPDSIICDGP